ncbi:MAG: glucoamylase family protein [Pseudomonadota bacterium]|uniref:glucoamylase family protein n=1 Tax=Sphingomonas sp. ERG5 TaxID=1381597 RepID=UPI00054B4119|nr:glucoamylase family protein [Sphingomonas sp. ERG5]
MIDRRQFLCTASLAAAGIAIPGIAMARKAARFTSERLIGDIQHRSFRFFWETADPATGLVPDRWPTPSFASIAAVGFGLTTYPVGVHNGWISRAAARDRTLATLRFFAEAPQGPEANGTSGHKGFFYHFLDAKTGRRFGRTELSTVDTAWLVAGVLFAQSWYDGDHPDERKIRDLAEQIYRAVDWPWAVRNAPFLSMGWHPETGFIRSDWDIYNEGMLLYILALGSPTHALPEGTWQAWSARFERSWITRSGQSHLQFPPLFGHQYSHLWIDFRNIRDRYIAGKGIDYFENSRRATYAQRAYAIENKSGWRGYGAECWGLTACDGPGDFTLSIDGRQREFFSYSARGPGDRDDGTIAPTAALGSIAFAPEIVIPTITAMHQRYGHGIYRKYGFLDSFNPTLTDPTAPLHHGKVVPGVGWVDGDYLGIDQGPIVGGIENHRSGLIWRTMRRNPHIRRGLQRAGFAGGWLS